MDRGRHDGVTGGGRVAHLLGLLPTDPDREPPVLGVAGLPGHLLALREGLAGAHLVRHGHAHLLGHRDTLLLRNILAILVGNLPGVGLGHLLALVVGNVLASPINGSPHLVIALSLPLVLAVLLVLGGTLGLSVRLVLGPVLLHTDVVVDGGALLLVLLV